MTHFFLSAWNQKHRRKIEVGVCEDSETLWLSAEETWMRARLKEEEKHHGKKGKWHWDSERHPQGSRPIFCLCDC